MSDSGDDFLSLLDLTEYEAAALEELLLLGRTTAPDLAEATGIPKARIYGVLDSLSEAGYVKIIRAVRSGGISRTTVRIAERAVANRRHAYERFREDVEAVEESFVDAYTPVRDRGVDDLSPTEDLFHVVDVGEPSERETRRLFLRPRSPCTSSRRVSGYIDAVRPAMRDAIEHGVDVDVLLLAPEHLSEEQAAPRRNPNSPRRRVSAGIRPYQRSGAPVAGTFIDPSLEYDSGQGLLMVEQEEIRTTTARQRSRRTRRSWPGLWQYFDLLWRHESRSGTQ